MSIEAKIALTLAMVIAFCIGMIVKPDWKDTPLTVRQVVNLIGILCMLGLVGCALSAIWRS